LKKYMASQNNNDEHWLNNGVHLAEQRLGLSKVYQ
jgi:hypothetical protein